VLASTTAPSLQVLASTNGPGFSIQLVNYHVSTGQTAAISLSGGTPSGSITRWELSARYPNGHASTVGGLTKVPLPAESIVILTGTV
jgi:carbohydrate-binding DOMON domain-containing protein